jgi:hypothetical protein
LRVAVARAGLVDARSRFACLVRRIDEWQPVQPELQVLELREHAVAERLGCDTRAIGHEEHGAVERGRRAIGHADSL